MTQVILTWTKAKKIISNAEKQKKKINKKQQRKKKPGNIFVNV